MSVLYFAYASNLLAQRMNSTCPSARFKSIAELKNFKLIFSGYSESWKGCKATIQESDGGSVWGTVWEVPKDNEKSLDGPEIGYKSDIITAISPTLGEVECKVYQKINIESEGLPSPIYRKTIIQGATEHNLPQQYIKQLEKIKDNGYKGPIDIPLDLTL